MLLNHVLICTPDLQAMEDFFARVVQLVKGPRPPFSFPGTWLYSGDRPVIHLAQTGDRGPGGAVDHIAFTGDDYPGLVRRLQEAGLPYDEHRVPQSGEQ